MFNLMCFENLNTLTNVGCVNWNIITSYLSLKLFVQNPIPKLDNLCLCDSCVTIILTLLVVYIETPTNPHNFVSKLFGNFFNAIITTNPQ
jgi:hypothetical protein